MDLKNISVSAVRFYFEAMAVLKIVYICINAQLRIAYVKVYEYVKVICKDNMNV